MKLDELKNGLATAWDSMTESVNEGWQRLRKAGKNSKTGRWHLEAVDFKLNEQRSAVEAMA